MRFTKVYLLEINYYILSLALPKSGRGLIAHARELGDRLGWLYVVLILLAKPLGKDKGTLEISLKILSQIMGKSLSQITRDLNDLAGHKNRYIIYQKAKGRYSRQAKIIIPKYPVDNSFYCCKDDEVNCIDAEVEGSTPAKNATVTCINAEVKMDNPNKINKFRSPNNRLITYKTNKSLITEGNLCGKVLFIISIRRLKDLNIDIKSKSLRRIIKDYCLLREKRGWCIDPELCYPEVVEVFNKITGYKVTSPLSYLKQSLENFLNEKAEEISRKVAKMRETLVKNP